MEAESGASVMGWWIELPLACLLSESRKSSHYILYKREDGGLTISAVDLLETTNIRLH